MPGTAAFGWPGQAVPTRRGRPTSAPADKQAQADRFRQFRAAERAVDYYRSAPAVHPRPAV